MKFGILGTAGIGVKSVIPAVQASEHEAAAIASRDEARASAVADELGIPTAYGSYEALLADDSLDAVYIPLPNGLHADWVRAAADRGLHVLCEKPLTASADETAAVFDYCEDAGVTLMEAFMYRFHPLTERAAELVASELGAVVSVTSNFSFRLPDRADDIRIDPDLAGGSVMDVGCYAVSAARLFLGTPDRVYATTTDTRDCGVDTRMSGVLEYDSGATARVESSFDTPETQYYRVKTTDGWLEANPASTSTRRPRPNSLTRPTAASSRRRSTRQTATAARSRRSPAPSRPARRRASTARNPCRSCGPSTRFTRAPRPGPQSSWTDRPPLSVPTQPNRTSERNSGRPVAATSRRNSAPAASPVLSSPSPALPSPSPPAVVT